ncbi:OmpA family protein [Flavobacterium phycosphaerae]|uniref:OmpA family protein n=1 Tax=Flavobacterium phycosphaerae TaxID=2697515 RepID=UPI00138B1695|nr:OmpA family protein [Flavobacterium phycosphaerae]
MKNAIFIILFLVSLKSLGQNQFEVFFDFNKDFPNEKSILEFNEWFAQNKNLEVTKMMGYCDSVDTKNYNIKLAERRINSVQLLLQKSGVKVNDNLERIAYGKDFKQSKIQAENRKVTIFYNEIKSQKPVVSPLTEKILNSKVGETVALPNIYFFNNSARIVPKSEPTLLELLCILEENPKLKIEIQGHICCQKVFDVNDVSLSRARAIYTYLLRNKIDRKRMTFKGYGTSRPVHPIPEKSAQEEDENRRVEVMILEK